MAQGTAPEVGGLCADAGSTKGQALLGMSGIGLGSRPAALRSSLDGKDAREDTRLFRAPHSPWNAEDMSRDT